MAKFVELPILYNNEWIMAPINVDSIAYIKPIDDNLAKLFFSGGAEIIVNKNYEELSEFILSL